MHKFILKIFEFLKNIAIFLRILTVFFFLMSYFSERKKFKSYMNHLWIAGIVGGSSGIGNLCKMVLMSLMNLSLIFPLINAGGIIVTSLVAIFVYKEKLTVKQYLGVLCGIITIVFVGL